MPEARGKREVQERADRLRVFRQQLADLEQRQVLVLTEEQRARLEPQKPGSPRLQPHSVF